MNKSKKGTRTTPNAERAGPQLLTVVSQEDKLTFLSIRATPEVPQQDKYDYSTKYLHVTPEVLGKYHIVSVAVAGTRRTLSAMNKHRERQNKTVLNNKNTHHRQYI